MTIHEEDTSTDPVIQRHRQLIQTLSEVLDSGDQETNRQWAMELVARYGTGATLLGACLEGPILLSGMTDPAGRRLANALKLALQLNEFASPIAWPMELDDLRIRIGSTETVLVALRKTEPGVFLTLALGAPLNALSPVGGYIARLTHETPGQWWIVYARPQDQPSLAERMGAVRFLKAAQLVGIEIERFIIRGQDRAWEVYQSPQQGQRFECSSLSNHTKKDSIPEGEAVASGEQ